MPGTAVGGNSVANHRRPCVLFMKPTFERRSQATKMPEATKELKWVMSVGRLKAEELL